MTEHLGRFYQPHPQARKVAGELVAVFVAQGGLFVAVEEPERLAAELGAARPVVVFSLESP